MEPTPHLKKIEAYLRSIEAGDFGCIAGLSSPDAVVEQLPNRIYPNGIKSGVVRMAEAFETGRKLMSRSKLRDQELRRRRRQSFGRSPLERDVGYALRQPGCRLPDARPLRHVFPVQGREDRQPAQL